MDIFLSILTQFLSEWDIFQKKICRANQYTFYVQLLFFWEWCRLWDYVDEYCRDGQATDDNMVHALCVLDT